MVRAKNSLLLCYLFECIQISSLPGLLSDDAGVMFLILLIQKKHKKQDSGYNFGLWQGAIVLFSNSFLFYPSYYDRDHACAGI